MCMTKFFADSSCPGILFPFSHQYTVCRLIGIIDQFGSPVAFWKCSSIDHAYLYGISITHGILLE